MMIFGCSFYSLLYLISKKLNIMENLTLDYKTILYTGIFISILLISVCIPLLLKFGIIKGRTMMTVVFMAIIIMPSFTFVRASNGKVISLAEKLTYVNEDLLLILLSLASLIISYFISCKIYNKKELLN